MGIPQAISKTWVYLDDAWHEGDVAIMGARTHATWLASSVFDGARTFEGVSPDIRPHFERVNLSAERMYLKPSVGVNDWLALAREGVRKFERTAALYIRPMYWAQNNGPLAIAPDPDSTRWCLAIYESAMPEPAGFSLTLSPFRRPTFETMPVDAKAGCLYPNNARAVFEAKRRGFDNCVMCDALGHVAEFANANLFIVKDGAVHTPAANGTFLAGITRNRLIDLLRGDGIEVRETILHFRDIQTADEIFSTGNYAKILPATRVDERRLEIGPIARKARQLYWEFAHAQETF